MTRHRLHIYVLVHEGSRTQFENLIVNSQKGQQTLFKHILATRATLLEPYICDMEGANLTLCFHISRIVYRDMINSPLHLMQLTGTRLTDSQCHMFCSIASEKLSIASILDNAITAPVKDILCKLAEAIGNTSASTKVNCTNFTKLGQHTDEHSEYNCRDINADFEAFSND